MMFATSVNAADYGATPYSPQHGRMVYEGPAIRQAPPVIWVQAPPQYVQRLLPISTPCIGCVPSYAAVGQWERMAPPTPLERFFSSDGY
jgi:hypothetical protein